MEGRTGYYRPELEQLVCYTQGQSIIFEREDSRKWIVWHPLDLSPIPLEVVGNLTALGWTLVYQSREFLARAPLAAQSLALQGLQMKQMINDMADVALGMVPKGMVWLPTATIIYNLTDRLMDILLMLQTATSTSRPHCLC